MYTPSYWLFFTKGSFFIQNIQKLSLGYQVLIFPSMKIVGLKSNDHSLGRSSFKQLAYSSSSMTISVSSLIGSECKKWMSVINHFLTGWELDTSATDQYCCTYIKLCAKLNRFSPLCSNICNMYNAININVTEKKHKCKRTALYHCVLPVFFTVWKVHSGLYQFWKNISFQVLMSTVLFGF